MTPQICVLHRFDAKGVCDGLGLTNAASTLALLDEDEKSSFRVLEVTSKGGNLARDLDCDEQGGLSVDDQPP